jgi:hypothetical protein
VTKLTKNMRKLRNDYKRALAATERTRVPYTWVIRTRGGAKEKLDTLHWYEVQQWAKRHEREAREIISRKEALAFVLDAFAKNSC